MFKSCWAIWMANSTPDWTPSGNRRKADYDVIAGFCAEALKSVNRAEMVQPAFECCGLTTLPTFDDFETYFSKLNGRLQNILHPDPLNVSRELSLAYSRLRGRNEEVDASQLVDEYVGLVDFNCQPIARSDNRINRRAFAASKVSRLSQSSNSNYSSLAPSSLSASNSPSTRSLNSTLPDLSFGIDKILSDN